MKIRLISLLLILVMCLALTSCGNETQLIYTPDVSTEQADKMFEQNSIADLKKLCNVMAGNNDYPQERDNFFNYILTKVVEIDRDNIADKYEIALETITVCLKQPLTQAHVINGLKATYASIDTKLTQQTMQYMTGKWRRVDNSILAGMIVEVSDTEEYGFSSKITTLPDDESLKFKANDVKWFDIQFANHKKFYFNDLVTEESNATTYYKNESKTVTNQKGATATINFEKDVIVVTYDASGGVTTGARQVWVKVGSEGEKAYQSGEDITIEDDEEEEADDENIEDPENADDAESEEEEEENDFSISEGKISNTTATASSVKPE